MKITDRTMTMYGRLEPIFYVTDEWYQGEPLYKELSVEDSLIVRMQPKTMKELMRIEAFAEKLEKRKEVKRSLMRGF